jgi:hypothetical protein
MLLQAKQISNEQTYQRTREATFREISESASIFCAFFSCFFDPQS